MQAPPAVLQSEWCMGYALHTTTICSRGTSAATWRQVLPLCLKLYSEFPHLLGGTGGMLFWRAPMLVSTVKVLILIIIICMYALRPLHVRTDHLANRDARRPARRHTF